jgi:hypothetical protein
MSVWGFGAALVGGGAAIYSANSAANTARDAASRAAWQGTRIVGPDGDTSASFIDPVTGQQVIGGRGTQGQFGTQLTSAGTGSLSRFANLQNSLYNGAGEFQGPFGALDPTTAGALAGAENAFGPSNRPPDFFGGDQSQFQNQGQQALQGSNAGGVNLFQQLGQNGSAAYSDALGRGFTGASADALGALQNFDPSAYAAQAKRQLDSLAAPGETTQTQSLFNGLQSSGRLGLTQNGELGDIGGSRPPSLASKPRPS